MEMGKPKGTLYDEEPGAVPKPAPAKTEPSKRRGIRERRMQSMVSLRVRCSKEALAPQDDVPRLRRRRMLTGRCSSGRMRAVYGR